MLSFAVHVPPEKHLPEPHTHAPERMLCLSSTGNLIGSVEAQIWGCGDATQYLLLLLYTSQQNFFIDSSSSLFVTIHVCGVSSLLTPHVHGVVIFVCAVLSAHFDNSSFLESAHALLEDPWGA